METLITGARVYTGDGETPWAEAVLVRGNRIASVGSEADMRDAASGSVERIHISGGLAVPGLNDSHIHMSYGAHALTVPNLEGIIDPRELLARLHAHAASHPHLPWIEAVGVFYEAMAPFAGRERQALDGVAGDRPLYLQAFDYHSAWCNTVALRRAGIERGAEVRPPNEVVVDGDTGLATGMLKERMAFELVSRQIPAPSQDHADRALVEAMRHVNRLGITSVQNMNGTPELLAQYERLRARGNLSVRAHHYLNVREDMPEDQLPHFAECCSRYADEWNRVGGIKLFIDGVIESKTALLFEPYGDGSGDRGIPDMSPDFYRDIVMRADALDMDVATHAVGDRGVCLALDAYEAAWRVRAGRSARRHRVEHIEVIRAADMARFARLGVTASMQPLHAAPTTEPAEALWFRNIGQRREARAFAWQSLIRHGALLALGSDWPIVSADVRLGLYTALMRTNDAGVPRGGWQPQQSMTLAQALDGYTRGAAVAERQERQKGILRPGMLADITVFEQDLFGIEPQKFKDVGVALTMVDGRPVHRSTES